MHMLDGKTLEVQTAWLKQKEDAYCMGHTARCLGGWRQGLFSHGILQRS